MIRAGVAEAYDARADEYVATLGSVEDMAPQDLATIESWRDGTSGRLLDAGCGPGHWTDVLTAGGRRQAIGVDASARFVSSARERFPHVPTFIGDLSTLSIADASFGGVVAWFSIIHTEPAHVPDLLAELARVLMPGGSLLLGFFAGDEVEPFDHAVTTAYYWPAAELGRRLAQHGFSVEHLATRHDPGARRQGHLVATLQR